MRNEKNPLFDGETLWEFCKKNNEYLSKNFDKTFTFDGDTIEIMTIDFYNKSIKDVLEEHALSRKNLVDNLNKVFVENNIFQEYGRINFMKNSWFAPPIGWTYIGLRLPLTALSFGKCYFWDHHCNLGR